MQVLNNQELAFLAVLGHPELTSRALKLVGREQVDLFHRTFSPALNVMWQGYTEVIKKYKKEYGLRISKDLIAAGLSEKLQASNSIPGEMLDKCDTILRRLMSGAIPPLEEGMSLIKELVQLDANRRISAAVRHNPDIKALQEAVDRTKRTMSTLDTKADVDAGKALFSPFKDIEELATHSVRIPTGINWLDEVSSGGGRSGELWLILGPSGGGKTVIAVQYSCAQALMGNNTLWATYEQSLEGDISERLISYVTGHSLDDIRDKGFNNLEPEIQQQFWTATAGVTDKLQALDMTKYEVDEQDPQDNRGMYSVWKHVRELKAKGIVFKSIIIDWIGAMMSQVGAATGKDLSKAFRFMTQAEIDIARAMAKEENVQVIFFHQTNKKSQNAKPTYAPDKTDSKDMSDMNNYFDIVLTLGNRDKNNIAWFNGAKSRKAQEIRKTIELKGAYSKFVLADGYIPNRDGNFYKPSAEYEPDAEDDDEVLNRRRMAASSYSREIN